MTNEYRVVWRRDGGRIKVKRYVREAKARRFLLRFGPEPWLALEGKAADPDALWCCPGTLQYECGCGGETVREHHETERAQMEEHCGPLLYVRLDVRKVGPWGTA